MFKQLIVLPLALTAFTAHAATGVISETDKPKPPHPRHESAKHFKQVAHAVSHGRALHVVIDSDKCKSNVQTSSEMLVSIHPKSTLLVKGKRVAFSNMHFTTHHPRHLGSPVYQFTKYSLNEDDTFTIKTEALNPTSFETLGEAVELTCKLNHGVRIYSGK